jgi:hypothetical protein
VIRLDAATLLLQWATGGLVFLWVTTRRREVSLGYGWLLRGIYAAMALVALVVGLRYGAEPIRELASAGVAIAAGAALAVSVVRRRAGVIGQRERRRRRAERVATMTGGRSISGTRPELVPTYSREAPAEFPPVLDLVAPLIGTIGLIAGALAAGGEPLLAVGRTLVGAAFLGCITDAMLLGHWYLVQPGMPRDPLLELIRWSVMVWPIEVALLLVPTGMISVLTGEIDDGYGGLLGWFWVACAAATGILLFVARAALRERYYSAVMATTGLLYLAILTALGTDVVARAVLAG